jgi:hypothetical protein
MNMNNRKLLPITLVFFFSLILAACQSGQATPAPTLPPVHLPTNPPVLRTPVATPTARPTPALPSPTPIDPAVKAAQDYFSALQNGDAKGAAALYSNFSLMVDEVTRGDAESALNKQIAGGAKWSGLEVLESKPFDPRTTLVHVRYNLISKDATTGEEVKSQPEEWWAVRQESGQSRINRGNLIDFETLDVPAQTTARLTMKPRQLTRYTDRIRLTLLAQNQSNDPIVLGQPNEVLATFKFGDQSVEAVKTRLIFDRLRSYPETILEAPGLFEKYPDGIVIRQWKNIKEKPWFNFSFNQ